jgi:hypothetical protein
MKLLFFITLTFVPFVDCFSTNLNFHLDPKLTYLYFLNGIQESKLPPSRFDQDFDLLPNSFFETQYDLKIRDVDSSIFESTIYTLFLEEFWNINQDEISYLNDEIEENYDDLVLATDKIAMLLGVNQERSIDIVLIPLRKKKRLTRAVLVGSNIVVPIDVNSKDIRIHLVMVLHEIVHLLDNQRILQKGDIFGDYIIKNGGENGGKINSFLPEILATVISNSCWSYLKPSSPSNPQWYNIVFVDRVSKRIANRTKKFIKENRPLDSQYLNLIISASNKREGVLSASYNDHIQKVFFYSFSPTTHGLDTIFYKKLSNKYGHGLRLRYYNSNEKYSLAKRHVSTNKAKKIFIIEPKSRFRIEQILSMLEVSLDREMEILSDNILRMYHASTDSYLIFYIVNYSTLRTNSVQDRILTYI